MPRQYKGHYSKKHPPGSQISSRLQNAIDAATINGRISCKQVHAIAEKLAISPGEAGKAADLQEAGLTECQLGLFSHSAGRTIIKRNRCRSMRASNDRFPTPLTDGRLACIDAWRIAGTLGLSRRNIGQACVMLQIKISRCQLGAF